MFAAQEDAFEVVVDLRVPDLFAHLDRAARRRATDVVDQHIDTAKPRQALRHHVGNGRGLRDIAHRRFNLAARLFHQAHGLQQARHVTVNGKHPRAFLRKTNRNRPPVAPARAHRARAGNERHLAFQPPGHRCGLFMIRIDKTVAGC